MDDVLPGQLEAHTAATDLELSGNLNIYSDPLQARKTGIICTIGLSPLPSLACLCFLYFFVGCLLQHSSAWG